MPILTVKEFNQTYGYRGGITAVADTETLRIVKQEGDEVLVELQGKQRWIRCCSDAGRAHREWRERKKAGISSALEDVELPKSSLPKEYLDLPAQAFKLFMWIKSLDKKEFSGKYASEQLNIDRKTVRHHLASLQESGLIMFDTQDYKGYTVQIKEH